MDDIKRLAAADDEPDDLDIDQAVVSLMEEEGIGPRELIKEAKALLQADASKLFDVDSDGRFKLKQRMLPKHAKGLVEASPTKIKMVDKGKVLELMTKIARLQPAGKTEKRVVNNNQRQVFVALPEPVSREEAFRDYIDAEVISEPKTLPAPASQSATKRGA